MNEDDEDFQGGTWRSRNVPPQKIVYFAEDRPIMDDTPSELELFPTWNQWREWSQKRALTLYVHEWNRVRKNKQIESIVVPIGEDKETIWIVGSRYYNSTEGLNFNTDEQMEFDE